MSPHDSTADAAATSAVSFGAWVQQRRKALDLTQRELAQRTGCSQSAIRKIERDERRPSRQVAELLAEQLRLPPGQREVFLQVARAQLRVERLPPPAQVAEPVPRQPLPVPPTPLVGREPELAALGQLLSDARCRLLTLVGPGGIGKTRLALAAAARQQAAFANGACFVQLVPLSSSEYIVPAIADALGVVFQGQTPPRLQLLHYLRDRQVLLVLDNLEHLLAGVTVLAELLAQAPGLKLLVTSRERLNLQGEWVFEVHGLPVPPAGEVGEVDEYSAVALFVQSARRARGGWELSLEEQEAAARICRLVDGMPLGIELAAAWVRVLSCQEIAHAIEGSLDLLATSMRDVPERHRSITAVFDHSWRLLSDDERSVFRQLSVFRGGFTLEAARCVAGAPLTILVALADKSLLRRTQPERYDLHELVRQYAREQLHASGEDEATRQRHVRFFLALAEAAERHMYTREAPLWLNRLDQERDNLRKVLNWVLEPAADASHRIETGLRLASAMSDFWFLRGYHHEGLARFEALLARPETAQLARPRMEALTFAGYLLYTQNRLSQARASLEEALALNQTIGDRRLLALALEHLGLVTLAQGDYADAQSLLERSLAIWRELNAGFQIASVLSHLGDSAVLRQDDEQAERFYTQGIVPGAGSGDEPQHPYPLRRLAHLVLRRGDCEKAAELSRRSLRLNVDMLDRRGAAACVVALASVARVQGQLDRAARLLGAAEAILSAIAAPLLPADRLEFDRNLEAVRERLSEADWAAAWSDGRSMTFEQTIAYAL